MNFDWDKVSNATIEEAIDRVALWCKTPEQREAFLRVLKNLRNEVLYGPEETTSPLNTDEAS
jgi:hypothetical protein